MDKNKIAERLMELPGVIGLVEMDLLAAINVKNDIKKELEKKEAELLISPDTPINGKNAEIRSAQLKKALAVELTLMEEAEKAVALQRTKLTQRQNEFSALRSVVSLLTGSEVA